MGPQLGHQLRLCFCVCKCGMEKSPSKMLLVITAFFFAVVAKCGAVKLHFHHKLFPQGNTGSVNSISLSIMTRIHICAGQGRFGINIENGKKKKDPQSRATPHVFPGSLAFKCQRPPLPSEEGLWGLFTPPRASCSLLEYEPIHPTHSILESISLLLDFILVLPLPPILTLPPLVWGPLGHASALDSSLQPGLLCDQGHSPGLPDSLPGSPAHKHCPF